MNWNKMTLMFFSFGCWAKYFGGPIGFVFYNIWFVLVLFWCILTALGVVNFFVGKKSLKKSLTVINDELEQRWIVVNLVSLISFAVCGETYIALTFLLTSVLFMSLALSLKKEATNKKKKH